MKGSVAYAGQEPWIFSASVRENILFGQSYQMDWYNTVVDVCALNKVVNSCVLVLLNKPFTMYLMTFFRT